MHGSRTNKDWIGGLADRIVIVVDPDREVNHDLEASLNALGVDLEKVIRVLPVIMVDLEGQGVNQEIHDDLEVRPRYPQILLILIQVPIEVHIGPNQDLDLARGRVDLEKMNMIFHRIRLIQTLRDWL